MRSLRSSRAICTSVSLAVWLVSACSGDSKQSGQAPSPSPDGAAGNDASSDAAADAAVDAGSDTGSDANGDASVDGSVDASSEAGSDAAADSSTEGGLPAPGTLLFTVSPGARGLGGTGVAAAQPNAQSRVYGSLSASSARALGHNQLAIAPAALGLLVTDQIDALSVLRPEPQRPLYLFSLPYDGSQGAPATRAYREQQQEPASLGGDVFFSDGSQSYRLLGASSDQYGYNGLIASAGSLGLANPTTLPAVSSEDNLTGLALLSPGSQPSVVFFSVSAASQGASGSALAATPKAQMGCTVFESPLDGTSSVAFSCAALGLAPLDELDALSVLGTGTPSTLLFSVAPNAQGLPGSAVAAAAGATGSAIFSSTGDASNQNTLALDYRALGLASAANDVDALSVLDAPTGSTSYTSTCTLALDPFATDAGLGTFFSANDLGNGVLLLLGQDPNDAQAPNTLLAYDAQSCAFLQRATVAPGVLTSEAWAVVPLASWSASAPLTNIELWTLGSLPAALERRDASGALISSYPLTTALGSGSFTSLTYLAAAQQFLAVLDTGSGSVSLTMGLLDRPAPSAPSATPVAFSSNGIDHPCATGSFMGISHGLYYFAQPDDVGLTTRLCPFTSAGELAGLPFDWQPQAMGDAYAMGLSTGDTAYVLHTGNLSGPFTLEHAELVQPALVSGLLAP